MGLRGCDDIVKKECENLNKFYLILGYAKKGGINFYEDKRRENEVWFYLRRSTKLEKSKFVKFI